MAQTSAGPQYEPLGIGEIISETFARLIQNFLNVLILGGIPALVSLVLTWLLVGAAFVTGEVSEDPAAFQAGVGFSVFLVSVISIVLTAVAMALVVQLAYDTKLGRQAQPAGYIQPALASTLYIMVMSVLIGLMAIIPLMLLIVPGLWVYAVFAVTIPAAVIERTGFGALGRSIALTKEYRWPIVLLIFIVGLIAAVISFVAGFLVAFVPGGLITNVILSSVINGILYGIFGFLLVLIYVRLREIKEGAGSGDMVSVFE
ncbi:MAG: hypothetical protein AAF724_07200 [Pseudomonadota bacterium]